MAETFFSSGISTVAVYPGDPTSGTLTVSSGTYTHATLTLASILPNMSLGTRRLSRGTLFTCTGGTGATVGAYYLASSANNTSIVLTATLGAGADGQTNITGTLAQTQTITATYADSVFGSGTYDAAIHSIEIESVDATARTLTIYDGNGNEFRKFPGLIYSGTTATDAVPRQFVFTEPLRVPKGFAVAVDNVALKVAITWSKYKLHA